jgi:mannose-6-phosphate isomerase-like protein (cupin superfamily)
MKKISIENIIEFASEKSLRKPLFKENVFDIGLLLYEPGQTTPAHKHLDIDEIFYVISGQGTITVDSEKVSVKDGDILFSPKGENHGFYNTSPSRWTVLQIKITSS